MFEKQAKQKEILTGRSARQFQEGDLVWSRKYKGQSKWTEGIVREVLGPVTYSVEVGQS